MDVRDFLSKDDRFYAVEDETTREELFYDFVEEMRKREERTKRNKKREAKDAYLAFLKLREEEGKLTFASTW
jgi:pre-mRNA-processing factor 40